MPNRKLTIIESPFAANGEYSQEEHLSYLRTCLRDSWEKGELPFASHGFFPFFLFESLPSERKEGIEAGYAFWDFIPYNNERSESVMPLIAFYCDLGISKGMNAAMERAKAQCRPFEVRMLFGRHE